MKKKQKYSDEKVREAATILIDCGIYLSVPGWYGISTPDNAVRFARDPDGYYDEIKKGGQKVTLEKIEEKAQQCRASLDDYLYYLKFADPTLYAETGAGDADLYGGRCSAKTIKGHPCKNFVRFDGTYRNFKKGVSDRCQAHRNKK